MCLTASSTSLAGKCFWLRAIDSISSDFVISTDLCQASAPSRGGRKTLLGIHLLLQQIAERRTRRRSTGFAPVVLDRLRLLVGLLGLDGQRDDPRFAVDAGELCLDAIADFGHGAG